MRPFTHTLTKAFTLAELPVVVTILGILLALTVPAILNARGEAHAASCASRMHQMSVGLTLYAGDHGVYPLAGWIFSGDPGAPITWREAIYPNMTTAPASPKFVDNLFACPAVRNQTGVNDRRFALTYQINANRRTSFTGTGAESTPGMTMEQMNALRVPLSLIEEPHNTFTIVDGRRPPSSYLEANRFPARSAGELLWSSSGITPHNDQNNGLFCDGHVELLNITNTWVNSTDLTDSKGIWTRTKGD